MERDLVFGTEVVIGLEDILVGVRGRRGGENEVAACTAKIGARVVFEQCGHVAIDASRRDDAARKEGIRRYVTGCWAAGRAEKFPPRCSSVGTTQVLIAP